MTDNLLLRHNNDHHLTMIPDLHHPNHHLHHHSHQLLLVAKVPHIHQQPHIYNIELFDDQVDIVAYALLDFMWIG